MAELEPVIFSIEDVTDMHILTITMADTVHKPEAELEKVTQFQILKQGIQPEVNCLRTEEGKVRGPRVILLGSIASREALEKDPDSLAQGKIIGNQRLVIREIAKPRPVLLSGIIHPEIPPSISFSRHHKHAEA